MNTNASNHTQFFGFPLFAGTDKPSVLTDWNGTMEELDATLEDYRVRIAGCEQTTTSFMDQVNILKDRFTQVEARISGDETLINENAREIVYLKEAMIVADTSIKRLMSQLTDILTKNDQQDQAISQINSTLTTLTGRVDSLQTSLTQGLNAVGQRIDGILSDDIVPTETLLGRILATFLDAWAIGDEYRVGEYVYYQGYSTVGKVYRCLQANIGTAENSPENSEYWEDATREYLYDVEKRDVIDVWATRGSFVWSFLGWVYPLKQKTGSLLINSTDTAHMILTPIQDGALVKFSNLYVALGTSEYVGSNITMITAKYPGNIVDSVQPVYHSPTTSLETDVSLIKGNAFLTAAKYYSAQDDETVVTFIVNGLECFDSGRSTSVFRETSRDYAFTVPAIETNIKVSPTFVECYGKFFYGANYKED